MGALADPTLTRYRLRFLLQEIDLAQGETLIGRSAACHVSIEDPLVSRQHARVTIDGDRATIEDLGSRNGLQIGGRQVQGTQELNDGDRVRIGTQELVFCRVSAPAQRGTGPNTRQTGFMTHCLDCSLPYPAELLECPSCGSTARVDDDTLSGVGESQRNWTLQLLVEVLAKAQSLGRWEDVERVLTRARANVDEQLNLSRPLERELVEHLAQAAMGLSASKR
ncbi:MAG TPA: FHA domain-containing protein, partial [Polyangiaceae bacterium]|nr:FHA domain-containing protein [Polyangiaceae bacterium]